MVVVETISGAVIAGLVGVATVKYEMRAQRLARQRRWERRFEALIKLLNRAQDEKLEPYSEELVDISHKERVKRTIGNLDEHITAADRDFSDEFWSQYRLVSHLATNVAVIRPQDTKDLEMDSKRLEREAETLKNIV